jgi:putative ATPase
MKAQGYGQGYRYPHAEDTLAAAGRGTGMTHLPQALAGRRFYAPKDSGLEIQFREKLKS